jgi:hypothetical protein
MNAIKKAGYLGLASAAIGAAFAIKGARARRREQQADVFQRLEKSPHDFIPRTDAEWRITEEWLKTKNQKVDSMPWKKSTIGHRANVLAKLREYTQTQGAAVQNGPRQVDTFGVAEDDPQHLAESQIPAKIEWAERAERQVANARQKVNARQLTLETLRAEKAKGTPIEQEALDEAAAALRQANEELRAAIATAHQATDDAKTDVSVRKFRQGVEATIENSRDVLSRHMDSMSHDSFDDAAQADIAEANALLDQQNQALHDEWAQSILMSNN